MKTETAIHGWAGKTDENGNYKLRSQKCLWRSF